MNREDYLRKAIEVSAQARTHGNHPFGAILVGPDGAILLEAENTVVTERDATGHAETNLVRKASQRYEPDFLAQCTLVSSTEPCAMCAAAIYWSNIGALSFALGEATFNRTMKNKPGSDAISLPSREVLAHGQRTVTVEGPALEEEALVPHTGFWD